MHNFGVNCKMQLSSNYIRKYKDLYLTHFNCLNYLPAVSWQYVYYFLRLSANLYNSFIVITLTHTSSLHTCITLIYSFVLHSINFCFTSTSTILYLFECFYIYTLVYCKLIFFDIMLLIRYCYSLLPCIPCFLHKVLIKKNHIDTVFTCHWGGCSLSV